MANREMQDSWERVKTNIRSIWGEELTDEMLKEGRRDLNKMVDIIHENTGISKSEIRSQMLALF